MVPHGGRGRTAWTAWSRWMLWVGSCMWCLQAFVVPVVLPACLASKDIFVTHVWYEGPLRHTIRAIMIAQMVCTKVNAHSTSCSRQASIGNYTKPTERHTSTSGIIYRANLKLW